MVWTVAALWIWNQSKILSSIDFPSAVKIVVDGSYNGKLSTPQLALVYHDNSRSNCRATAKLLPRSKSQSRLKPQARSQSPFQWTTVHDSHSCPLGASTITLCHSHLQGLKNCHSPLHMPQTIPLHLSPSNMPITVTVAYFRAEPWSQACCCYVIAIRSESQTVAKVKSSLSVQQNTVVINQSKYRQVASC